MSAKLSGCFAYEGEIRIENNLTICYTKESILQFLLWGCFATGYTGCEAL
ncbi:MAG: hypothetical protein IJ794_15660 [Lachnospiraceae bacterium]|nr:hypothetical protein [Lachnospiraceae bacterium]